MTRKGNVSRAAKSLGQFSLKAPFGRLRICQDVRENTVYSYLRCSRRIWPSVL